MDKSSSGEVQLFTQFPTFAEPELSLIIHQSSPLVANFKQIN
jgi:hypothetical protein